MGAKTNSEISEKIIDATVRYIGEFGMQSITTRKIANYADVNPALVNYYFGSQDELIDQAISRSMQRYFSDVLRQVGANPERTGSALKKFLLFSMKDAIESPNILRSYLYQTLLTGNRECRFIQELTGFLSENEIALTEGIASKTAEGKRLAIIQMMSSILFICLMPDFFSKYGKVDFHEEQAQRKFVADLIGRHSKREAP